MTTSSTISIVTANQLISAIVAPSRKSDMDKTVLAQPDYSTNVTSSAYKMADSLKHQESGRTRIEWLSNLNTAYKPAKNYRRTSIICTIGPKTNSAEKINVLRKGMSSLNHLIAQD
jgi:hypothetical protein